MESSVFFHVPIDSNQFSLRSSAFSVFLPASNIKSLWYLLIEKQERHLVICLCQEEVKDRDRRFSKLLISECSFSFIHPESYEVKYSLTAPTEEDCVPRTGKSIQQEIRGLNLNQCVFNDTLTIQVTANLIDITNCKNTVDHVSKVPLSDLRGEMHSLYKAEVFTDATIKCGGKEFKVHKAVLGSQSPVFKAMLQADMKEKQSSVIDIPDITPAVMSDLVTYLYTGAAPNVGKLAKDLLNAADKYGLSRLFTMCENELRMKIKVANVVDTLLLADLHNAEPLRRACLNFIQQHSADVHKTYRWKYLKANLHQYAALVFEALQP